MRAGAGAPAWQRALLERRALGVELTLEAVRRVYEALGRPAGATPAILIVGTNGKGSTAAMCAHALQRRGLRVGLYTSPHLHRVGERVRVDGAALSDAALEGHVETVLSAESGCSARGELARALTFFEVLTLAAMVGFAAGGAEALVLEAGLGGRLDATRVGGAVVTAIAPIGLDHARYLGDTIELIAGEKAAVIDARAACVCAPQRPAAEAVIRRIAAARGVTPRFVTPLPRAPEGLPGAHQRVNGALALAAVEELLAKMTEKIRRGPVDASLLDGVGWPGRLERVSLGGGAVVLDVAHNLDGVAALVEFARAQPEAERAIVFGCMADKDADGMLARLSELRAPIWLVPLAASGSWDPTSFATRADRVFASVDDPALTRLRDELLARGGELWGCGSVYLIAELRAWIPALVDGQDAVALQDPLQRR